MVYYFYVQCIQNLLQVMSNPTIGGGEGIGEKYPLLYGEGDQKGPSRVWDRISR